MPLEGGAVTEVVDPAAGSGEGAGAGEGEVGQGSPGAPAAGAGTAEGVGSQPSGRDNPIPHWRHQQLLAQQRQQWESEQKQKAEADSHARREWEQNVLRTLGYLPEEQPQYVDASTFDERLNAIREELNTQWEDRFSAQSAQGEYEKMAARYPDWATYPGFGTEVWKRWAKNPNLSMDQIGDAYSKELEKYFEGAFAKKQAAAAAAAEETKKKGGPGKMVPGGGGGGAPPKTQGEQRKSVGQRILDGLNSGE